MDPKQNLFSGVGWLERSQERVEEYVEELVERGELKRKDSRHFIKRVMEQARGEREEFRKIIREVLTDALSSTGVATRKDLEELESRLDRLESKVKAVTAAASDGHKQAAGTKTKRESSETNKPGAKKKTPAKKRAAAKKKPDLSSE